MTIKIRVHSEGYTREGAEQYTREILSDPSWWSDVFAEAAIGEDDIVSITLTPDK